MRLELPVIVALMVAASALAIAAKRVRVPYNVALVFGGVAIAVSGLIPEAPQLDPQVVFLLCLPALLFEGGVASDLGAIRANRLPIALLSTVGMLLAVTVTGVSVHWLLGLPWGAALLLGAILSITDTVSILYVFRRAPVLTRLSGVILGESLFNDGTALVAYAAIGSVVVGKAVSIPTVGARMVLATLGGLAIGLALGLAASFVIRRTQDALAEIMVTTALAFAAYTVAEEVAVSGPIAAVTAGLTIAAALPQAVDPPSQVAIRTFWEYVAFGVNTFLFLSIGLSTNPQSLLGHWPQVLAAIVCVMLGRAAAIYLPFLVLKLFHPVHAAPMRWQHVFVAGNIKGALSIALALGLPRGTPSRELLVNVVFGVTFLSLAVQGPLLMPVLRRLKVVRSDPAAESVGEQQALLITARAARAELDALHASGLVPRDGYEHLRSEYQVVISGAERELRRLHEQHLAYGATLLLATRRRLMDAERTALMAARRAGLVPEAVAHRIAARIDERSLELERVMGGRGEKK